MSGFGSRLHLEMAMKESVPAGLWWNDQTYGPTEFTLSTGLVITGGTNPIMVNAGATNFVRWAAADAAAITMSCFLPGNYNEAADHLHLLLPIFKSTAGNTGINMSGALSFWRAGNAAAALSTIAPAKPISDATTASILDLDFSGSGLKGKDCLTFTLTPDAHATCVIDLFGACVRYLAATHLYNSTDNEATS